MVLGSWQVSRPGTQSEHEVSAGSGAA